MLINGDVSQPNWVAEKSDQGDQIQITPILKPTQGWIIKAQGAGILEINWMNPKIYAAIQSIKFWRTDFRIFWLSAMKASILKAWTLNFISGFLWSFIIHTF